MRKQYLECGKIVSTHGVRGEVKVQPWCDSPEYLCEFKRLYLDATGQKMLQILRARPAKSMVILQLEGYADIDAAAALRGKILYLDRNDDPDADAVFLQDMLGMRALDVDTAESYGILTDVLETGANDVYELTDEKGRKRLVPAIPQVVVEADIEQGILRIRPLKGLFDDAD